MLNFVLTESVGDLAGLGGLVALIGILMVFLVLALLILSINLFSALFSVKNKKKVKEVEVEDIAEVAVAEENTDDNTAEDDQTIAAIIAAINCFYEESGIQPSFVIRSVKPIKTR